MWKGGVSSGFTRGTRRAFPHDRLSMRLRIWLLSDYLFLYVFQPPVKPPMWAGTLGLEPSPNLLFHWAGGGFVLLDGSWAGQWPVTLGRPTRLWECADTHKAALAKSSSREGTGALRESPKTPLVHIDTVWLGLEVDSFLQKHFTGLASVCSLICFGLHGHNQCRRKNALWD